MRNHEKDDVEVEDLDIVSASIYFAQASVNHSLALSELT